MPALRKAAIWAKSDCPNQGRAVYRRPAGMHGQYDETQVFWSACKSTVKFMVYG
jgi:hypothetical protein